MVARRLPALALLATLAGSAWAQGHHPGDAVRIDGVTISNERFNGFYQAYRRSHGINVAARGDRLALLTQLRQEAMELLIEQELVRQAAERAGVEVDAEDVDAALAELREGFDEEADFVRTLRTEGFTEASYRVHVEGMIAAKRYLDRIRASVPAVDDAELEAYYHANEHRLTFPGQVRVRHILLTWKPMGTKDDRAAIRAQMAPILERARAGEDFAELARSHSEDYATARSGGDTGLFHRGQMAPAFEEVAFSLAPGEISEPVETPFGVHILKLEERREPRLLPLEEVREQLREHIRNEKAEQAVQDEMQRLREAADIQVLVPLRRPET